MLEVVCFQIRTCVYTTGRLKIGMEKLFSLVLFEHFFVYCMGELEKNLNPEKMLHFPKNFRKWPLKGGGGDTEV